MRKNSIKNTRVNGAVQKELSTIIKNAEGYVRRELARRLNLRNTPEIRFVLDESIEYGVNMSKKINDVMSGMETEE